MKNYLNQIRHFGIRQEQSRTEKRGIILLNEISLVVLLIELIMYPEFLFSGKWFEVLLIFSTQLLTVIPLILNYYHKTTFSKWYFNIVLTTAMTAVIMAHGWELRVDYCFLVFVVTTIIFFQKLSERLFNYIFIVASYYFSIYYTNNYPAILAENVTYWTSSAAFLATLTSIIVITSRFIFDSKAYEDTLRNTLKNLKEERKKTTIQNKKLEEANKELERFAYISSHNLKTPIRTIRSFTDLIERDMNRGNQENFKEYFSFIKQGTAQMQMLVTDILEFSRFNQQIDLEITSIDVNKVVYYIISQLQSLMNEKGEVEVEIDNLPTINSNQTFINSIFQNLIENAIKYNESEKISIQIIYQDLENKHQFQFIDNGIGIDEEYFESIFKMFERLHNTTKYEGTGIGLAMTKKMIERLNGKIYLASTVDEGSTFIIELPK